MIVQRRYERVFMEPPYDGCVGMDGSGSKIAAPTGCGGSLGVRRLKRVGGWPMAIPTLSIVHFQLSIRKPLRVWRMRTVREAGPYEIRIKKRLPCGRRF